MGDTHLYIKATEARKYLGGDWKMLPKLVNLPEVLGREWDLTEGTITVQS